MVATALPDLDRLDIEALRALVVEQHAQKILPITDRALILERGRVVHESASAALLVDSGPLERFLGVAAR